MKSVATSKLLDSPYSLNQRKFCTEGLLGQYAICILVSVQVHVCMLSYFRNAMIVGYLTHIMHWSSGRLGTALSTGLECYKIMSHAY